MNRGQSLGGGARGFISLKGKKLTPLWADQNNVIINNKFSKCEVSMIKKIGFTLAEVLITLGIIGVVAALTLPTLIQRQQEKATVTALKKFYSSFSQAYMRAIQENGTPDTWYENGETRNSKEACLTAMNKIIPYMKTTKVCGAEKGCFKDITYKTIDNSDALNINQNTYLARFITSDGMSVFINSFGPEAMSFGEGILSKGYLAVTVDVNGFKKPNSFGADTFTFEATETGVLPTGAQEQTSLGGAFETACKPENCAGLCEGCGAWVILNENLDYLRCHDKLGWDKARSCKEAQ